MRTKDYPPPTHNSDFLTTAKQFTPETKTKSRLLQIATIFLYQTLLTPTPTPPFACQSIALRMQNTSKFIKFNSITLNQNAINGKYI